MFKHFFAALAAFLCLAAPARADLLIAIDKSTQQMTVSLKGETQHVWPVSTGRAGFGTPNGEFRPQWMARRWFSRQYYNSPMPYSIFFHRGYAIHGTTEIHRLGGPASHGCVRLKTENAAILFALVNEHGKENVRIEVAGENPVMVAKPAAKPKPAAAAKPLPVVKRAVARKPAFAARPAVAPPPRVAAAPPPAPPPPARVRAVSPAPPVARRPARVRTAVARPVPVRTAAAGPLRPAPVLAPRVVVQAAGPTQYFYYYAGGRTEVRRWR